MRDIADDLRDGRGERRRIRVAEYFGRLEAAAVLVVHDFVVDEVLVLAQLVLDTGIPVQTATISITNARSFLLFSLLGSTFSET